MDKRSSILVGVALVLLGVLSLVVGGLAAVLEIDLFGFVWRLWPVVVIGVGLLLLAPPFVVRGKPALGAFLIPGFPILTTGTLLLLASVLHAWSLWSWLWPMLIISLGMGFLFAAIYMRIVWLLIPALFMVLNGLAFQFCAISGLWHWWSVLWTIEPLAVGLSLLACGVLTRISGVTLAGLIVCGVGGSLLLMMLLILGAWFPLGLFGPGLLIVAGLGTLGWAMMRHLLLPRSALE